MKVQEVYKRIRGRKYLLLIFTAAVCMVTLVIDISTGPARLSVLDVFSTIFFPHQNNASANVIVRVIRLPVSLMAIVVGASLSIAGAEMQTILNNPLASPYTLGVSAGAGFGAALALVLGVSLVPFAETVVVPLNAFFFSFLTCILIFLISKQIGRAHV